jgi:hypothetical protein
MNINDLVVPGAPENAPVFYLYPCASSKDDAVDCFNRPHVSNPSKGLNQTFMYAHCKGNETIDDGQIEGHNTNKTWDKLIEIINLSVDITGPDTVFVSVHNLSLLQRAAWWWSRRHNMPDPVWNSRKNQRDMVEMFHGPLILTAEERYSFSIIEPLITFDMVEVDSFNLDAVTVDEEFGFFKDLWKRMRVYYG